MANKESKNAITNTDRPRDQARSSGASNAQTSQSTAHGSAGGRGRGPRDPRLAHALRMLREATQGSTEFRDQLSRHFSQVAGPSRSLNRSRSPARGPAPYRARSPVRSTEEKVNAVPRGSNTTSVAVNAEAQPEVEVEPFTGHNSSTSGFGLINQAQTEEQQGQEQPSVPVGTVSKSDPQTYRDTEDMDVESEADDIELLDCSDDENAGMASSEKPRDPHLEHLERDYKIQVAISDPFEDFKTSELSKFDKELALLGKCRDRYLQTTDTRREDMILFFRQNWQAAGLDPGSNPDLTALEILFTANHDNCCKVAKSFLTDRESKCTAARAMLERARTTQEFRDDKIKLLRKLGQRARSLQSGAERRKTDFNQQITARLQQRPNWRNILEQHSGGIDVPLYVTIDTVSSKYLFAEPHHYEVMRKAEEELRTAANAEEAQGTQAQYMRSEVTFEDPDSVQGNDEHAIMGTSQNATTQHDSNGQDPVVAPRSAAADST